MVYLVFAFVSSAMVSIVLKAGEKKPYSRYAMLSVNYITCLLFFLLTQIGKSLPSPGSGFALCLLLGSINGVLYIACMAMNQINVRRNGAILQSTFARLGVMVPTLLSILFFGEKPEWKDIAAIILVLVAFSVMNIPDDGKKKGGEKPAFGLLLLSLFFGGTSDSMSKIFQEYGERSLDDWFIGITFFFAFLICLFITIRRKEKIGRRDLVLGFALGIPNYISSLLLLLALSEVNAYIAYPTYSVGAILTVILSSLVFFGEKIQKWSRIGVVMIIAAIILLNI